MEIRLLGKRFRPIEVIDIYTSFIWTDRYYECGDFEIDIPAAYMPKKMAVGMYVSYDKSDRIMLIETIQIDRTSDDENLVKVTGRSIEILLDRRAVYEYLYFNGKIEDYIHTLLNNAMISPKDPSRKIENFTFKSSGDADISAITAEEQHQGSSLYTVVCDICKKNKIGWRIRVDNGIMIFDLYRGRDKTASVIFSEMMNNIAECQMLASITNYRNAALIIGGEETETGHVYTDAVSADIQTAAGIERREMVVNSSMRYTSTDSSGNKVTMSQAEYLEALKNEGRTKLTEYRVTSTANGKTDSASGQFEYGTHFKLGDIVTIDAGFLEAIPSRVTEATFSIGTDGFEQYQSFERTDDDNKEEG